MIGTITHILAKAGYNAMNGSLADERRRLAGAVPPAAYVSYDPRLLAGAGWYGYRIALKGGDRSMLERARYMLEQQYVIRDSYEYYTDDIYTFGVLLRQRVPHYGIGGGGATPEPDALNFYMPDGGTITLTRTGTPTVVELEYSIDGGATWQVWEEVGNVRSLTLAAGQKMYVRNTSETPTMFSTGQNSYYQFYTSSRATLGGYLESLMCMYPDVVDILYDYNFRLLFYQCNIANPPLIRSTKVYVGYLLSYAFWSTFNATPIEEGPELFIEDVKQRCFPYTFKNCSNMKSIKVHFTHLEADALDHWLEGVAATGDFYCPAELTIPTGASGIPTGWTRHDI